ncbi:MAG: carboxypeptidase-like regulatory domain-containing protein [Gemmatimonadaceae bacterium]|nr:carboxypeptidase-like regulatory domain-containing protein [Gemmatimonadaceae bacterium]
MRAMYRSAMILLVAATAAGAQAATSRSLPPGQQVCDMSLRLISIRLVNAQGAPVPDAAITVRRVRTRTMLANAEAMGGQGDYRILEDGVLPDLRRGGEPFDVRFTKDGRVRRVRLVIGMDAGGCHVMLKSGPTKVSFQ